MPKTVSTPWASNRRISSSPTVDFDVMMQAVLLYARPFCAVQLHASLSCSSDTVRLSLTKVFRSVPEGASGPDRHVALVQRARRELAPVEPGHANNRLAQTARLQAHRT